jgi:hypothetical protein
MTTLTTITAETLPAMTWQQARVITTELLAKMYAADDKQIHDNFQNNQTRFVAGKHYFRLEGAALKEFKSYPESVGVVQKHARHLILWTERGAARHAKMLDTEAAWEVFEKLEDCYFRTQEAVRSFVKNPGDVLTIEQADLLRSAMTTHCARLPKSQQGPFMVKGWSKLKAHFKVSYRLIPQEHLTEALSIITRHAADWEVVDGSTAVAASTTREDILADALSHGRWIMTGRDGRLILTPLANEAFVTSPADLPEMLAEPAAIPIRSLPGIIEAATERLSRWMANNLPK